MASFKIARFIELVSLLGNELAPALPRTSQHLSPRELSCLKIVEHFGPLNMRQISDMLDVSKSRATQLINDLEDYDLVRRIATLDKRSADVKIMPKGRRLLSEVRKNYLRISVEIQSQLSTEDFKAFEQYCEQINFSHKLE